MLVEYWGAVDTVSWYVGCHCRKQGTVARSRLVRILRTNRSSVIRFGHYDRLPRASAFRAMYSFTGHSNNDVCLNISSSNRILNISSGHIDRVRHGIIGMISGHGVFRPTPVIRARRVRCSRQVVIHV